MSEVGVADADIEQARGVCPELGTDILGGGSVCPVAWVRDIGDDAVHQEVVGWIPPQVSP